MGSWARMRVCLESGLWFFTPQPLGRWAVGLQVLRSSTAMDVFCFAWASDCKRSFHFIAGRNGSAASVGQRGAVGVLQCWLDGTSRYV